MNRMSQGILAKLPKKHKSGSFKSSIQTPAFFQADSNLQATDSVSSNPQVKSWHPHLPVFQLPGETTPESSLTSSSTTTFVPVHYQSSHAYPVLVWLHSAGGDQRELFEVMPAISERNYIGLSIRNSELSEAYCGAWRQDGNAIQTTVENVQEALESLAQRFNLDPQRIFIAGADAGGTMAYRVAFQQPKWFAGVGSLNGQVPQQQNPLGNLKACRRLPVFWAHGRTSVNLPESHLCQQLRLLHTAGFDVTLRQYPCGDQLIEHVYQDMDRWMMEIISKDGANIIA